MVWRVLGIGNHLPQNATRSSSIIPTADVEKMPATLDLLLQTLHNNSLYRSFFTTCRCSPDKPSRSPHFPFGTLQASQSAPARTIQNKKQAICLSDSLSKRCAKSDDTKGVNRQSYRPWPWIFLSLRPSTLEKCLAKSALRSSKRPPMKTLVTSAKLFCQQHRLRKMKKTGNLHFKSLPRFRPHVKKHLQTQLN